MPSRGEADGLRLTPWRMLFVEGVRDMPKGDGLVTEADDPILRVIACTGAPACREAHAETRALAAELAAHIPAGSSLHVRAAPRDARIQVPHRSPWLRRRMASISSATGRRATCRSCAGSTATAIVADPSLLGRTA